VILVKLNGGLGNQLFQYAAGRSLAIRHGTQLILDSSSLEVRNHRVTQREVELVHFSHLGRPASPRELQYSPWLYRMAPFSHWLTPWRTYVEKGLEFNPAFNTLPDQTCLVGYWQSHRYFSGINNQLMAEFEPIDALSPKSMAVATQIDLSTSVALHIRRGDYVSLASAASFHGALPLSYYMAAVARVRECVVEPKFFVFSDDQEWCRDNLQLGDLATFVDHNSGSDSWQDLVLMGRCRHHVIANSSFSWWGAWLADQRWGVPRRLVITPARWFSAQPGHNLSDRFPVHWEMIG